MPAQREVITLQQLMERAAQASRRGSLVEAEKIYSQILQKRPDLLEAQHQLAILRVQQGRNMEALALMQAVLKARPNSVDVLANYGTILLRNRRIEEALVFFDRALAIYPDNAAALNNRGNALSALGREEDAIASYRRALAIKPDDAEAYNNIGYALAVTGRLADAEAAFVKAVELDPKATTAYVSLAKHRTFTANDPHLIAMQALDREEGMPNTNRIDLHFALGKAYADLKDRSGAFEHFLQGNALKRTQINYDEAAVFRAFARIQTVFTRDLVVAKAGLGNFSPLPIFVIGMPRSGTTLIEQILSSHSDVRGAGELTLLSDIVRAKEGSGTPYPEFVASAGGRALKAIGATYVAELQKLGQHFKRVTDKMPQNYLLTGLIHLVLPNARIIHVVRDPIDTCISCFSTLFARGYEYTYDLAELGRYYRRYQALMTHWHGVLPAGSVLDVRYEDVVSDLEGEARRIFTYCGLDWDPRCLEFHQIDRPVRTSSVTQVRQPIYKSAIGHWRAYEPYLGPLLAELEPAR
jgi:Flp pilus assembly protein TadD